MVSNSGTFYKLIYDDGDYEHKELVLRFIKVLNERTESWGFKETEEDLGVPSLEQLHDDLDNTNVTIVVILPNHDERKKTKAQHDSQTALMKAIENKEKRPIPICLMGGKSKFFALYPTIDFPEEADWEKPEKWEKLKKALEKNCQSVSKKHVDTTEDSMASNYSSKFMTDKFFADLSKQIGNDWWKLGIRLRLKFNDLTEIESTNRGQSSSKIIKMLLLWKQSFHTDSEQERVAILCQALRAEKINDVAKDVNDRYKDFSKASSTLKTDPGAIDKSITNDVFLLELTGKLPVWNHYCLQLGVTDARLESLKQDYDGDNHRQAFQALVIWRREAGDLSNEAKMDKFIDVFQQAGRMDIVEWIKEDATSYAQAIQTEEPVTETARSADDSTTCSELVSTEAVKSSSSEENTELQMVEQGVVSNEQREENAQAFYKEYFPVKDTAVSNETCDSKVSAKSAVTLETTEVPKQCVNIVN